VIESSTVRYKKLYLIYRGAVPENVVDATPAEVDTLLQLLELCNQLELEDWK